MHMELKEFLKPLSEKDRDALAASVGCTTGYFWQLTGGHRKASPKLAKAIELATNGVVTKQSLRPDIFE